MKNFSIFVVLEFLFENEKVTYVCENENDTRKTAVYCYDDNKFDECVSSAEISRF